MNITEQIKELAKKDTNNYHGRIPMEYSLVMYTVPKNKIKPNKEGPRVYGGRAIFAKDFKSIPKELKDKYKNVDEYNNKQIKQLFTAMLHVYNRDKLGYREGQQMSEQDKVKFSKELERWTIIYK